MDPKTGNSIYHYMDYCVWSMVILGMEYEMNEQIKQLAREAGAHISTRNLMSNPPQHVETVELWDDRIEKFAELIVRDIAAVLRESAKHQSATGSESDAYILRSHASGIEFRYGVKE